jgi:hypothetical protein
MKRLDKGFTASLFNTVLNVGSENNAFSFLLDGKLSNRVADKLSLLVNAYFENPHTFVLNDFFGTNSVDVVDLSIKWILRSGDVVARRFLQKYLPQYEDLDHDLNTFEFNKQLTYARMKENVRNVNNRVKDKLEAWDHEGHVSIIRNPRMIERYEFLITTKKYLNQPINLVLTHEFYMRNLKPSVKVWFEEFCEVAGLFENVSPKAVAENFGLVTSLVKKYRTDVFGESWTDLCDLGTLLGYNMKSKIDDMVSELREWIEPKVQVVPEDIRYYSEIEEIVFSLFKGSYNDKRCTLANFISDSHLWVVSGSSNGIKDKLYDHVEEKVVMSGAKKAALFTTYSAEQLLDMILDDVKQEPFLPNVKVELGMKDRMILACSNIEYLRMSYLSFNLEPLLKGTKICPFYEATKFKFDNYNEKVSKFVAGKIALPFDAKSFDKYCRRDEILAVFRAFKRVIEKMFNKDNIYKDCIKVMELIINSLEVHNWSVKIGDDVVDWVEGMPSGLRWTSLVGTLINYARARVLDSYISSKWDIHVLDNLVAAGDDDDFIVDSWFGAFLLFKSYELFSIPGNAAKTFISNTETEFLKNVVTKDGRLIGYKARKVANLFFISPEKLIRPEGTFDDINFSIYDTCTRRGLLIQDELDHDTNWRKLSLYPRSVGGFGLVRDVSRRITQKTSRKILVEGRFSLDKIKQSSGFGVNVNKTRKWLTVNQFNIDFKRWESGIRKGMAAAMLPIGRTNILSIKDESLYSPGVVVPMTDAEFYSFLLKYSEMKHLKSFRVKQEYSWMDYRSILSLLTKEEFLRFVEIIVDPDCKNVFELIKAQTTNTTALVRMVREWMSPRFSYCVPYSERYSVEYLSAYFSKILERATIDSIIHDRFNRRGLGEERSFEINKKLAFEAKFSALLTLDLSSMNSVPTFLKTFFNQDLRVVNS